MRVPDLHRIQAVARAFLAAIVFASSFAVATAAEGPSTESQILRVYVDGEITPSLVANLQADIRRWLAEKPSIGFIIFELKTPGGQIDPTAELAHFMFADLKHITTVAYIPPGSYAFSGGALLAVAARKIVMGTDSRMGAAAPVAVSGLELKELGEKFQAAVRSYFKSYAEDRGYPTILTDAMVSKDHEDIFKYRFRDPEETRFLTAAQYDTLRKDKLEDHLRRVGEPTLAVRKGQLLVMTEKDALSFGFIEHVADDLTELRNALGIPVGNENVFDVRSGALAPGSPFAQAAVDLFQKPVPRFLLILAGSLALLVELKTFGLIVPGLISFLCFTLFFLTSLFPATGNLEGTASVLELVVFLAGVTLIGVEVFLVPGMGIFALVGAALAAAGVALAMVPADPSSHAAPLSMEDALAILSFGAGGATLIFFLILRFLPHSRLFAHGGLVTETVIEGVPTADTALLAQRVSSELVGLLGTAASTLRPAGKMETLDGRLLDVATEGDYIETGTPLRVARAGDGRIIVVRRDAPKAQGGS